MVFYCIIYSEIEFGEMAKKLVFTVCLSTNNCLKKHGRNMTYNKYLKM